MDVDWSDVGDAGGHGGSVLSLWGECGQPWIEAECGELSAPLDCYLPLLSPQGC